MKIQSTYTELLSFLIIARETKTAFSRKTVPKVSQATG